MCSSDLEVRVVGALAADCSFIRIGIGGYQSLGGGSLDCVGDDGTHSAVVPAAGQIFRLSAGETCRSRCVSMGPGGYAAKRVRLGSVPSYYPTLQRESFSGKEYTHHTGLMNIELQNARHDVAGFLRTADAQLGLIEAERNADKEKYEFQPAYNVTAIVACTLAVILIVFMLGVMVRYKRCKSVKPEREEVNIEMTDRTA